MNERINKQIMEFSPKKKEILLFVTTWIKLDAIMLNEIRQRKTNIVCSHLYVKSKRTQIHRNWKLIGARGSGWSMGKMGEGGQRAQTSS